MCTSSLRGKERAIDMAKLARFDPPAGIDDFDSIPNQRQAWDEYIERHFDWNIAQLLKSVPTSQFYNPKKTQTPAGAASKVIRWNGFPRLITIRHPGNKEAAWKEAEKPVGGERP